MASAICGRFEEQDYVSAQYLNQRPTTGRLIVYAALCVGLLIVASGAWSSGYKVVAIGVAGGTFGAIVGLLVTRYVYVPWKARRVFREQKSFRREFELSWDSDALTSRDEHGQYRTPWSDFTRWRDNERIFLLNLSDALFHMVPKRAFSNAESLAEFRQILQRCVVS